VALFGHAVLRAYAHAIGTVYANDRDSSFARGAILSRCYVTIGRGSLCCLQLGHAGRSAESLGGRRGGPVHPCVALVDVSMLVRFFMKSATVVLLPLLLLLLLLLLPLSLLLLLLPLLLLLLQFCVATPSRADRRIDEVMSSFLLTYGLVDVSLPSLILWILHKCDSFVWSVLDFVAPVSRSLRGVACLLREAPCRPVFLLKEARGELHGLEKRL